MQFLATPMPAPAPAVADPTPRKASSRVSSVESLGVAGGAGLSAVTAKAAAMGSASSNAAADSLAANGGSTAQNQTPVLQRTVTLVSNSQFTEVLQETLNTQPLLTPQRISIELQTPPGETVTVFFSQSNGQLRAQLSASDSSSMQWLQQQIGGLRENSSGPSVVWLPPQLDTPQDGRQQQPGGSHQQHQPQNSNSSPAPTEEEASLADSLFGAASALSNN